MRGIITKAIGGFFFTADDKQNIYRCKLRGKIRDQVYPGDYVEFEDEIVEQIYDRERLLHRPAVANVDQVLIVLAVSDPAFNRRMLDRFLIIVEEASLKPLIVINKIELADSELKLQLDDYLNAGYEVCFVSVNEDIGLEKLKDNLHQHINVFTGPSGVGKSSLINKLIVDANLKVGEVSKRLKRGVHTTRQVDLLPVVDGGWIADTPGFTSLDLSHVLSEELTYFYPEFLDYQVNCKFRGCSHTHEPKCAVKDAVENGEISKFRYNSYKLFYEEVLKSNK